MSTEEVMGLLNDENIARYMPLSEHFDEAATRRWVESKDRQWSENGYGPWAVSVDADFAGWCGFQKEGADADFAMVLSKRFWGWGKQIYAHTLRRGFEDLGFESIVVTLPPSRKTTRVLDRLGFVPDGETEYWGRRFLRFRLSKAGWHAFTNRTSGPEMEP